MKSLLYYFIEVTISSGILYGYYHFFLRNKKFHLYNRYYLLAATVLSFLVPLLNIPVYFRRETNPSVALQSLGIISPPDRTIPEPTSAIVSLQHYWFTWQELLISCYILVSLIILARLAFSLVRIWRMTKTYPFRKVNSIYFVNTSEPGTPFSFFRWLFWNRKIELRSEQGGQIFRHELFHIEQRHSYDILYMELLTTFFWVNPFFHLIKKEVKTIHEFLADSFAMDQDKKWEYAELLLMQSFNTHQALVNPFFHNQLKRRIAMITSFQKTSYRYLRKLMALPVIAIVFLLFAFKIKSHSDKVNEKASKPVAEIIHAADKASFITGGPATDTSKPKSKQQQQQQKTQIEKQKAKESEKREEKEMLEEKQLDAEKAAIEFKQRMEEQQLEQEKQELEFKQMMTMKQLEIEKTQLEFKQMMVMKQHEIEAERLEFKKRMDTMQSKDQEEATKKFKLLMDDKQRETEKMQKEFEQSMRLKQLEAEKNEEEFKKRMSMKQKEADLNTEELKKMLLERQKKLEEQSKTINKKD
jgi:hypothetical protein